MKSNIAKRMDDKSVLDSNLQANDILQLVDEEYGVSHYGTVKYTHNEMYWIGYIYRYFAITYEFTSARVYKIIKPKELRELFLPYHTLALSLIHIYIFQQVTLFIQTLLSKMCSAT